MANTSALRRFCFWNVSSVRIDSLTLPSFSSLRLTRPKSGFVDEAAARTASRRAQSQAASPVFEDHLATPLVILLCMTGLREGP